MIGDRYLVKEDFIDGIRHIHKGDILTEIGAYNFETECREEGGEYNDLVHPQYGFICEVGSVYVKEFLEFLDHQNIDNSEHEYDC